MYRVSPFIRHFAFALMAGALLATIWLNLSPDSYYDLIEKRLVPRRLQEILPNWLVADGLRVTLLSLTSQFLMAPFLFFLGKELWEANMLERGALHGQRGGLPLIATIGGMAGAAVMWLLLSSAFETADEANFGTGWSVALGSDVVLGYLVGRVVFGKFSPALHVLMLLTIGMDLAGLIVLGFAFPAEPLRLLWLALPLAASFGVWYLVGRFAREGASERQHQRAFDLWPYLVAGLLCWIGVAKAGLPPALGLLPIIPAIPHADRAFGLFAEAEEFLSDPLNRLAHCLVKPLILVMFLFGLTRGGVDLGAYAPTTSITLGALWLGKPLGILLAVGIARYALRLPLPRGVGVREIVLIAGISGIGFTIPALAIDTGLPGGAMTEAARMGLALSLLMGPLMLALSRIWR